MRGKCIWLEHPSRDLFDIQVEMSSGSEGPGLEKQGFKIGGGCVVSGNGSHVDT